MKNELNSSPFQSIKAERIRENGDKKVRRHFSRIHLMDSGGLKKRRKKEAKRSKGKQDLFPSGRLHTFNGMFQRFQISASESEIGLHVISFAPFVPGFDEYQPMLGLFE